MISWFKKKIITGAVVKVARRLAYQPSTRVMSIITSLATLTELCHQQMQDGDWTADEKEVFIASAVQELLNVLEGGE